MRSTAVFKKGLAVCGLPALASATQVIQVRKNIIPGDDTIADWDRQLTYIINSGLARVDKQVT